MTQRPQDAQCPPEEGERQEDEYRGGQAEGQEDESVGAGEISDYVFQHCFRASMVEAKPGVGIGCYKTIHTKEPEDAELDDSSLIDPPPDDMLVDMVELKL
jgi:hypothetical protein